MTQVVDASVVASTLLGVDDHRDWATAMVAAGEIAAPHLMQFEVGNIIRRVVAHGAIDADTGAHALAELIRLPLLESVPFDRIAARAWELRANVTTYDAAYVAVAELLECPLVTLDRRLARATAPRCEIVTPPDR